MRRPDIISVLASCIKSMLVVPNVRQCSQSNIVLMGLEEWRGIGAKWPQGVVVMRPLATGGSAQQVESQ